MPKFQNSQDRGNTNDGAPHRDSFCLAKRDGWPIRSRGRAIPHDTPHMTWGWYDSRNLFCGGLSPLTACRSSGALTRVTRYAELLLGARSGIDACIEQTFGQIGKGELANEAISHCGEVVLYAFRKSK